MWAFVFALPKSYWYDSKYYDEDYRTVEICVRSKESGKKSFETLYRDRDDEDLSPQEEADAKAAIAKAKEEGTVEVTATTVRFKSTPKDKQSSNKRKRPVAPAPPAQAAAAESEAESESESGEEEDDEEDDEDGDEDGDEAAPEGEEDEPAVPTAAEEGPSRGVPLPNWPPLPRKKKDRTPGKYILRHRGFTSVVYFKEGTEAARPACWVCDRPTRPRFGFAGDDDPTCCTGCKQEGMVVVKPKRKLFNAAAASEVETFEPEETLEFPTDATLETLGVSPSVGAYAHFGSPLAGKGGKLRGDISEAMVRSFYSKSRGYEVSDAPKETASDGKKKAKGNASFDFVAKKDGGVELKVEAKNARLCFNTHNQRWELHFEKVKLDKSDRVLLAVELPHELRVFEWDMDAKPGYSTHGKAEEEEGGTIVVCGARNQLNFEEAMKTLLDKMEGQGNEHIGTIPLADPDYKDLVETKTRTSKMYEGVLFADLNQKARGVALENLARAYLASLGMNVEDADGGLCVNGSKLGKNRTEYDFKVDGEAAEVKSCQMSWNKHKQRWRLKFADVKRHLHERLFLVWMTKGRIHMIEYFGDKGSLQDGEKPTANGKEIVFTAPGGKKGCRVWTDAEKFLLKNIKHDGARYLACITHTTKDAERVSTLCAEAFAESEHV